MRAGRAARRAGAGKPIAMHQSDSAAPGVDARPRDVVFVLVPDYSFIAFSSAVEPLRMANRMRGERLYRWRVVSVDGTPVASSSGLFVQVDGDLGSAENADLVIVCAGEHVQRHADRTCIAWLRGLARRRIPLGAICTGAYLLARADLLDGYRCTIHWENLASLREEYPDAAVSSELFEIDRDRYTCSGGVAPLDMMLNLIEAEHGSPLAVAISEEFVCERIRGRNDRQRIPLRHRLGTSQPKLVEAVSLMEANLEEPMRLDELSRHVGLSRRQLERLFRKHVHREPARYYLDLRLARARQLLLQTARPIVDIAFACGFVSAPHFSKCYRDRYGVPPRDERRLGRPPGGVAMAEARTGASPEPAG